MKAIIILTFLISFLKINGQITDPTFDTLAHDINNIRLTQNDTCITIRLPSPHFTFYDSLPGIGEAIRYAVEYLIYKVSGKTFSKKYVLYYDHKKGSKIAVSRPLATFEDSIFDFLKKSIDKIDTEEIYPYIYEVKNTKNELTNYNVLRIDHPTIYSIGFYTSKKYFYKSIDWDALQENVISNSLNLNYKSNIETKLNSVYKLLLGFIDRTDKLYTFKK
jgi:hypothetical protein